MSLAPASSAPKITPKTYVVVKRMWHSPEIHAFIDYKEIGARMEYGDFIRSLVAEIYKDRNRFVWLTESEALSRAIGAGSVILDEMKKTTVHVV